MTSGFGGASRPALSPDGKTLDFVSRRDNATVLVLRDLASGAREGRSRRGLSPRRAGGLRRRWTSGRATAFTPDGTAIVSRAGGKLPRFDVAGGARRRRSRSRRRSSSGWRRGWPGRRRSSGAVRARILRWASQSPDGKHDRLRRLGPLWIQDVADGKASARRAASPRDAADRPASTRRPSRPTARRSRT